MNSAGKRIAKNAGFLMASQIATWIFSLVLTIMMPRFLGVEGIGQLRLATSIWAIVMIVATFGMDTLLTKEIAREPEKAGDLFGTSLILRLLMFLAGGLTILVYLQFIGYSAQTVLVIYVIGFSSLIGQGASTFDASLKGLERMEYTSLASVVSAAVLTVLRVVLLLLKQNVVVIAAVAVLSALAGLVVQYHYLRKLTPLRFTFRWNFARQVLANSMPYFFVNVVIVLYHQVDVLMLSWLLNEKSIGWYGVTDQLIGTLLFIPTILMTALFPNLSRMFVSSQEDFKKLARKIIDMSLVVSIPIGLGILLIANQVVSLLFGSDFAKSGPILAVRGLVLIFTYLNTMLGLILIVSEKQKVWARVIFAATLVTIPLDLFLIPFCERMYGNGALGGAVSFLITDFGMFLVALRLIPSGILGRETSSVAARVFLAGCLMVGITWAWKDSFLAIPILISIITYGGSILLLRVLKKEDWAVIQQVQQYLMRRIFGRSVSPTPTKG